MAIKKATEYDAPPILDISEEFPFLNYAFKGGFPMGRTTMLWGEPSSGKSSLSLKLMGLVQKKRKEPAIWVDVERTFDKDWAKTLGVNVNNLYVISGDTAEEIMSDIREVIKKKFSAIVIDSIAAFLPGKDEQKNPGEVKMAELARMLSVEGKIWNNLVSNNKALCILINQVRQNMSLYGGQYRNPSPELLKHLVQFAFKLTIKRTKETEHWDKVKIDEIHMKATKSKISSIRNKQEHIMLLSSDKGMLTDFWSEIAPASEFYVEIKKGKGGTYYIYKDGSGENWKMRESDILKKYGNFVDWYKSVVKTDK